MTNFALQMTLVRDLACRNIPLNMGFPNLDRRSLILRIRNPVGLFSFIQIKPDPIVNELDPNIEPITRLPAVQGGLRLFEVKGVSAQYSRQILQYEAIEYILDGKLVKGYGTSDDVIDGTVCHLKGIRENTTTWDLTLQQPIGEQRLW